MIRPGSVVVLKSNPENKMTVEHVDRISVTCVWFDANNSLQKQIFPIYSLMSEGGQDLAENILLG